MNARERVASLTKSFQERDVRLIGRDPLRFEGYGEQLERARDETGLQEACIWGWSDIGGIRCALVVFDFAFMGGSMGIAVGEKVARAFDAARRAHAPVVTVTASGGARMQEGMWALAQMSKTVVARTQHAEKGLAHVAVLASPTTGGVYASFASLADVIYAEEGATLGFAGPRVIEELTQEPPDPAMHTPEFALGHGLIDAIVSRDGLRSTIARAVAALSKQGVERAAPASAAMAVGDSGELDAWDRLDRVRDPSRPKAPKLLDVLVDEAIELRGDRSGAPDDEHVHVRVGLLRSTRMNAVCIGQDSDGDARIRPQGFRKAIRAIELAGRLGLPVVTLIDTRGADPTLSSEATGVASVIARTFAAMITCPSPTVAALVGEGGSGGALSMAVADRVVAWENAVFSVIAPEGASSILYRSASRAPELANRLGITLERLVELELVDLAIPEPPGGVQANPQLAMRNLATVVADEVTRLSAQPSRRRLRARHARWRSLAGPSNARRGDR